MFKNREEAGVKLAQKLSSYKRRVDVLVLGIPRGGVVTAQVVSEKLKIPLDVLVTRKIGAPNQPELAIGAVGPAGTIVLDKRLIEELGVEKSWLKEEVKSKSEEVKRRIKKFRGSDKYNLGGKTVIVVDDGIATGATVEVGLKYLTLRQTQGVGPKKLILAVPVAAKDSLERIRSLAHKIVVLETPPNFSAVGQFYQYFPQVTDEEVVQLLP